MAGMTPLPPHILHSSIQLTHAQAHAQLSAFLDNAESNAAYRPDSMLTERGPQSASSGANPNLTLHHLQRILQGMEGKRVGGEDIARFFGDEARAAGVVVKPLKRKLADVGGNEYTSSPPVQGANSHIKQRFVTEEEQDDGDDGATLGVDEEGEGWQDKDAYDLAQRDIVDDPDLEEREQPGVAAEQPEDKQQAEEMLDVHVEGNSKTKGHRHVNGANVSTETKIDREARKKAKKERARAEKQKKHKKK